MYKIWNSNIESFKVFKQKQKMKFVHLQSNQSWYETFNVSKCERAENTEWSKNKSTSIEFYFKEIFSLILFFYAIGLFFFSSPVFRISYFIIV